MQNADQAVMEHGYSLKTAKEVDANEMDLIKDSINRLEAILSMQATRRSDREEEERSLNPQEQCKLSQWCRQRTAKPKV